MGDAAHTTRPLRLLVVLPSWVGDSIMATPALRVLRELLPGSFIGALARPGIEALLAGTGLFDEVHTGHAAGMMGPKRVAAKLRPRRYDTALLMTNSFSTALVAMLAGIPRRVGYDRDGRGLMLTDRLQAPRRGETEPFSRGSGDPQAWAPVPACRYYFDLARHLLGESAQRIAAMGAMELAVTPEDRIAAREVLARAGMDPERAWSTPLAILNPGGNDAAKRWPAERFGALADELIEHHGLTVLVSGSPAEAELAREVVEASKAGRRGMVSRAVPGVVPGGAAAARKIIDLPPHGVTLSALKAIIQRCRIMVTNDTGPRHMSAALGVPVVTLFGPTDHRWTTIPFADEIRLLADPDLPEEEVANDHPERCRIERIGLGDVVAAANRLLNGAGAGARAAGREG